MIGDVDFAFFKIDPGCGPKDQSRVGGLRQFDKVNVQFIAAVVARDKPRQHARIRCGWPRIDQRQPRARKRLHRPRSQNQRVGVPAADEHEVLG